MENAKESSYPRCISCGSKLSPQDSRGWLALKAESDMMLCPNCIMDSDAYKDGISHEKQKHGNIVRVLADFKYLLDRMDSEDSPAG